MKAAVKQAPRRRAARAADRHEAQAHEAGRRFARGDHGLRRLLTAAPAASFSEPASVGEALPCGLREQLEQSFDVGLGAIRIHRDAAARRSAVEQGADAFASGNHIYFAAGQFAPHAEHGRTLIAHEVAHVLQQATRISTGGRREVRAISGAGEVQRWTSPLSSREETRTDADLMTEHLATAGLTPTDVDVITRLRSGCAAPSNGGAQYWAIRSGFVISASRDPDLGTSPQDASARVASALYDGLKISGLTIAAAKLLNERHDLMTLFFSAETYERFMNDFGADFSAVKSRFYEHWNSAEWFGSGTPRSMLDRSMVYLVGPSASNTRLQVRDGEIGAQAPAELDGRLAGTLGPDELYYVTVLVAWQLDLVRFSMFQNVMTMVREHPEFDPHDPLTAKFELAGVVKRFCDGIIGNRTEMLADIAADPASALALETMFLWLDDLAPALSDMAQFAIEFFEFNAQVSESLMSGEAIDASTVVAQEALADIDTSLPGYRTKLEEFLHSVLDRLADGSLPEPRDFARRRDAAVRTLDREMFRVVNRRLADRLFAAYPSGSAAQRGLGFDAEAANRAVPVASRALFVWALITANDLHTHAISEYDSGRDAPLIARQRTAAPDTPATDLREIFRVRIARHALTIAEDAGWAGWVEWVRPIVEGGEIRHRGDTEASDYVAFGTDWIHDPDAPITTLREDIPGQIEEFEPLRTTDLVEFYLAAEYDTITRFIDELLGVNRGVYTLEATPVINQAFEAARRESRPQRYLVRDWEWVSRKTVDDEGEPVRDPRVDARQLILEHPFTLALMRDITASAPGVFTFAATATTVDDEAAAVLWSLPTPVDLISRIQQMPQVSQLVLDALPALVTELPSLLDPTSTLTDEERADLQQLVTNIESGAGFDPTVESAPPPTPLVGLTLEALMALEWNVWWSLWRAVLSVQSGARQESLLEEVRLALVDVGLTEDLHYERTIAFDLALAAQRRALAHERRVRVETQLRPALAALDQHSMADVPVPGMNERRLESELAKVTIEMLEDFVFDLPDREERAGHAALAVLELADTLQEKLGSAREIGDITTWVPYLDTALVWANDPEKGGNAEVRDSFTVEEERGDAALFESRRATVQSVLEHMADVLSENFREWGVVGVKGDGTIENPGLAHPVGNTHRTVSRGTSFTIHGQTWEIIEVTENFWFHPGSFELRSMSNRAVAGSMLYIGSGEPGEDDYLAEGSRPHTLLMRVMIDEGPDVIDVYADEDPELLRQLTWALHMHATLEQLGALADTLEAAVGIGMDLAELFPGGGQALAAARLITTATAFFAGEGPALIADLVTNPQRLLNELLANLGNYFTVDNLIGYLLFSNDSFEGLIRAPRAGTSGRVRGGSNQRLRRLLRKVQSFARGMGQIFVRVHAGVQDKRQTVEHTVQNSPQLVRLVQIVADYYLLVASLSDHLGEIEDLPGALGDFRANLANLPAQIDEMIARLGEVELPSDILPLDSLVEVLLDLIGHRLGGKYRLGVRVLWALIDLVGARDTIVGGVTHLLEQAGVNSDNIFPVWKEEIVPAVGEYLGAAQVAIRNTLAETFSAFGAPLGLATPEPAVTATGEDFPEESIEASPLLEDEVQRGINAQGAGSLSAGGAAPLLNRVAAESGEPIDPTVRADAEARFGEDFSHVRVHSDARAREATSSVGARALTSGSHVILGEGAAEGGADDGVLFHELAHVVQQTGSRPAGSPPRAPRTGRSRRGVRIDPRAEAAADSAAESARRGGAQSSLAAVSDDGLQPDMIELYGQRFLRQLVDITAIEQEVAEIDESNATTGRRLIGRDVRAAVSHVAANLNTLFRRTGTNGVSTAPTGSFHDAREAISAHLQNWSTDIGEAVEDVAVRASYEAERARDGNPPRMALDISDFTRGMERYIFGKTGILLDLEYQDRGSGRDATFASPTAPYDRAQVKYVFLANVHGNTRLWQEALTHRGTAAGGRATTEIPRDERAGWRTQIRAVLRDLGPSASVWASSAYCFAPSIFAAAETLTQLQQTLAIAGTLPHGSLPSTSEYLNTAGTPADSALGNLRLHLGKYGQKGAEQSGKERESHHITQYLLVEYFHNGEGNSTETNQDRKGFPLLSLDSEAYGDDLVVNSSGVPLRFRDVKIDELEQGRGAKMPTILLARPTHRRGNLHINPNADDFNDASVSTQAGAINHIYKRALGDQAGLEHDVVAGTRPYSAWEHHTLSGEYSNTIYNAMQQTYRFMCNFMQPRLRNSLITIERSYYNDLHAQENPTAEEGPMTVDHMNEIANRAIAHNKDGSGGVEGLEHYGWHV